MLIVTELVVSWTYYRPQRSCEGYVFTGVCVSTRGEGVPGQVPPPWDQVHPLLGPGTPPKIRYTPQTRYTPSPQTRYTPWDQVPPQDQVPPRIRYTPQETPDLRTVRILLECILVIYVFNQIFTKLVVCVNFSH